MSEQHIIVIFGVIAVIAACFLIGVFYTVLMAWIKLPFLLDDRTKRMIELQERQLELVRWQCETKQAEMSSESTERR